jgi:hypothetical protein
MNTNDAGEGAVDDTLSASGRVDDPSLAKSVGTKLTVLERMDHAALRAEWRRLYRAEAPKRVARELLMLGVGWKIQEQAYGGLRGAARRALAELSKVLERDGDVTRSRVTRLKPGAKLIREWHGKSHTVIVREEGFEWRGKHWRSLSVIARTITGMHCSGPRFFGMSAGTTKSGPKSKGMAHA